MNYLKRIDHIDLINYKLPKDEPSSLLFRSIILESVNSYLYFILKSDVRPNEFMFSCDYFFRVRSTVSNTWNASKVMKVNDLKGKAKKISLSDDEVKILCFDYHFQLANFKLTEESFILQLKKSRKELLESHWDIVLDYLSNLSIKNNYDPGYNEDDIMRILIAPNDPQELAKLLCMVQKKEKINAVENSNNN